MTINEKILQYVDFIGVSQRKFTSICGLSEGALRGSKSVGADKMIKIKQKYPDLNMNWVLFNEGNMILTHEKDAVNEESAVYEKETITSDILALRQGQEVLKKQNADILDRLNRDLAVDRIESELKRVDKKIKK